MKRLKNRHLFNGKSYPAFAALIAAIVVQCIILAMDIALAPAIVMPVTALLVLVICFAIEHHLSAEERQIIAEAPMPLWNPVNKFVMSKIASKYEGSQFSLPGMLMGSLGIGIAVFVIGILPPRHSVEFHDPAVVMPIAVIAAVVGFLVMLLYKGKGANWLDIDESAMYTVIPVHHCFEVKHQSRSRYRLAEAHTWYENYAVFYQPDGRYVLKLPSGAHFCSAIIVVKFHGGITWLPVDAFTPEDML